MAASPVEEAGAEPPGSYVFPAFEFQHLLIQVALRMACCCTKEAIRSVRLQTTVTVSKACWPLRQTTAHRNGG